MAAGQIMIREAGGVVSGMAGDDDPLQTGHLICGNEFVHKELVKIRKPLRRDSGAGACSVEGRGRGRF